MQSQFGDLIEWLVRLGFSKEFIVIVIMFIIVAFILQSLSAKIKKVLIKMTTVMSQISNLSQTTMDQMEKEGDRVKSVMERHEKIEQFQKNHEKAYEISTAKDDAYREGLDDKMENINDNLREMKKILILWTNK